MTALRIGDGFFQDIEYGVDEVAHCFLSFGFGGLYQKTLGHQQREIDGGGVLRRTIFRSQQRAIGLHKMIGDSYGFAEDHLLRWHSVLEHTYCQQSPHLLDMRYCNARGQSMVG
ncbi:hypothetical protein CEK62_17550 [Alcanivorax sp. N3-2A]|nr:hypothetical protein CEK62_17550 [Alcanivorax sp. N3-2A]